MKYYYGIVAAVFVIVILGWAFNHISAGVSIVAAVVLLGFLIPIFNYLKNKLDK